MEVMHERNAHRSSRCTHNESLVDSEGHLINTWADILPGTALGGSNERGMHTTTRRMRHIAYQQHMNTLVD